MSSYVAQPISRNKIREVTNTIRKVFGLLDERFFPVVEFLEIGLPQIDKDFVLEIDSLKNMGGRHGLTYPEKSLIILREDVYENAIAGVPMDRFTVAHEIGHYFLHKPNRIAFARENAREKRPSYIDPEWQANTFAGELLAPPHLISGLTIQEIMQYCGVSFKVGEIQANKN